ncbi:hypothetical protein AB0L88_19270 [Saccharopolyspora shandongensis]|uniref:hypothetical protein n=1 Tax=Saccharopolyspora shandongensis TaxID=418495 RepID=UPI00341C3FF6
MPIALPTQSYPTGDNHAKTSSATEDTLEDELDAILDYLVASIDTDVAEALHHALGAA